MSNGRKRIKYWVEAGVVAGLLQTIAAVLAFFPTKIWLPLQRIAAGVLLFPAICVKMLITGNVHDFEENFIIIGALADWLLYCLVIYWLLWFVRLLRRPRKNSVC